MKFHRILVLLLSVTPAFGADFNPRQVVRPFDPIKDPKIAPANEAGKWVQGDELVLGVKVKDEARAYPINQGLGRAVWPRGGPPIKER